MRECEFDKAFELAGDIHRLSKDRPDCPMPAVFLAVSRGTREWTKDELDHLEKCPRCQKFWEATRSAFG
jgi:hypothetical protein